MQELEVEGRLERMMIFSKDGNLGSYKNAMLYDCLYLKAIKIVGAFTAKETNYHSLIKQHIEAIRIQR